MLKRLDAQRITDDYSGRDLDDADLTVAADTLSEVGDVWLLGRHRLVCGDSTDAGALTKALGGRLADMVWTDPPYGVAYQMDWDNDPAYAARRRQDRKTVSNDELTDEALRAFLRKALGAAHAVTKEGGAWYCASPGGIRNLDFGIVLAELGVTREMLIWAKDQFVFGRQDYHWRHEPIFYGWKEGAAHYFVDDRTQDTVWEIARPRKSEEHPTMKPVELVARAIRNSSREGELILDPFGGSGTTLIAAHSEGRDAALVELDPGYVDVICRRYQQLTDEVPVNERTGELVDFRAVEVVGSGAKLD
jgi:site-specific DNA-methyltransferase (adenine-specific)